MARRPRIAPPGSWHHVMNRGANHQVTFRDDHDRSTFVAILERAVTRFGIDIHAYCLMPNHYHVLIHVPNGQLSRAMKFIGQSYTQRFNHRHDRDGALFRGRFHSVLVDSDQYLDTVARYIHRNPIAKDSNDTNVLDSFRWSSLRAYEGRSTAPDWLSTAEVMQRFRDGPQYAEFVRRDVVRNEPSSFYADPFRQHRALGGRAFVQRIRDAVGERADYLEPGAAP